jgi:hypothetical protein
MPDKTTLFTKADYSKDGGVGRPRLLKGGKGSWYSCTKNRKALADLVPTDRVDLRPRKTTVDRDSLHCCSKREIH